MNDVHQRKGELMMCALVRELGCEMRFFDTCRAEQYQGLRDHGKAQLLQLPCVQQSCCFPSFQVCGLRKSAARSRGGPSADPCRGGGPAENGHHWPGSNFTFGFIPSQELPALLQPVGIVHNRTTLISPCKNMLFSLRGDSHEHLKEILPDFLGDFGNFLGFFG